MLLWRSAKEEPRIRKTTHACGLVIPASHLLAGLDVQMPMLVIVWTILCRVWDALPFSIRIRAVAVGGRSSAMKGVCYRSSHGQSVSHPDLAL